MTTSHYTPSYSTKTTILQWFARFWIAFFLLAPAYHVSTGNYLAAVWSFTQLAALFVVLPTLAIWAAYKNPWAVERAALGTLDLAYWVCDTRPAQILFALSERKWIGWIFAIPLAVGALAMLFPVVLLLGPPAMLAFAFRGATEWFADRFWPPRDVLQRHLNYIQDSIDEHIGAVEERDTV